MSRSGLHRRARRVRKLGLKWALATVAPWALSAGLLVSFTASAGQDPDQIAPALSRFGRPAAPAASELAEGPSPLVAATVYALPGLELAGAVELARLNFDPPQRVIVLDPRAPRDDLKRAVSGYPEVDRSGKGDPLPGLRPTLSQRTRQLERVVYGDTSPGLISGGFSPEAIEGHDGPQLGFEPLPPADGGTGTGRIAAETEERRGTPASPREAELTLDSIDGSTPAVPPAFAVASATPGSGAASMTLTPGPLGAPEHGPEAPAGLPIARGDGATAPTAGVSVARRDFSALIAAADQARQMRCLAEAIYFEARSESDEGRAAVAQVVLNRVGSGLYPDTVCGVVYQNRHRHLACQFTFACEGKSLQITEPEPWKAAVRIAQAVADGKTYLAEVGGSTHYHADYVRPSWARKLKRMDTIGRHVFYQLRPGQT